MNVQGHKPVVIATYISKGGTGKTTLTAQLAVFLAERGDRVAVLDLDRQGTQSEIFGVFDEVDGRYVRVETMHAALKRELDAVAALREVAGDWTGQLFVMPGGALTPDAVEAIKTNPARFGLVNTALIIEQIVRDLEYVVDYVVIDMGPSDPVLSIAGLVAADHLVIPVEPSQSSIERLDYVLTEVDIVRRNGYALNVAGIVQNKVHKYFGGLRVAGSVKVAREVLESDYADLLLRDRAGLVEVEFDQDWEVLRWMGEYQMSRADNVKPGVKMAAQRFCKAVLAGIEVTA